MPLVRDSPIAGTPNEASIYSATAPTRSATRWPGHWRGVGGVGSLVAAACIVGAAIALDRHLEPHRHGIQWVFFAVSSAALLLGYPFALRYALRRAKPLRWFLVAYWTLPLVFMLLTWVGLAAGIH